MLEPANRATPPALSPGVGSCTERLTPGELVGDFRIDHELGAGGTSVVYAATHVSIGKRAAIKVLRGYLVDVPVALEQFLLEGRVANAIAQRNVAGVFGAGRLADGRAYMLMELLPGETLRARLDARPLTVAEAARIGVETCVGLEAVHATGYVHGDIKPDNIFLTDEGAGWETVKLIDFGTAMPACEGEHDPAEDHTELVLGTPQYMAPERRRGGPPRSSADVYGLGVLLLEALVGHCPERDDDRPTLAAAAHATLARHPARLRQLIEDMLSPSPRARPALSEIRVVLASLVDDAEIEEVLRTPAPIARAVPLHARLPPPRADRRPRASWLQLAAVAAGGFLVTLALASTVARSSSDALSTRVAPEAAAVAPVANANRRAAPQTEGPTPTADVSPAPPKAAPVDRVEAPASPRARRHLRPRPPRQISKPRSVARETGDGTIDPFQ